MKREILDNMRKRIGTIILLAFTATLLVACGNSSNVEESITDITSEEVATSETTVEVDATTTPEQTEAPHEHTYIEDITTEATCNTDGVKTFTCECGDSYTETITATGHIFENYTSNNDATYTADGTETATCVCGATDTRTAEGSMLTYTYTDMDTTMYAQKTVNVRSMPNTDCEKLGELSVNDEVKVTGQCIETNWYRIEFDGNVAYVSDSYLGNDKVVAQTESSDTQTSNSGVPNTINSGTESANYSNVVYVNVCAGSASYSSSKPHRSLGKCPYPIDVEVDNEDGTHTKYIIINHGGWLNGAWIDFTPQGKYYGLGLPVDCYPYDEGCVHKYVY